MKFPIRYRLLLLLSTTLVATMTVYLYRAYGLFKADKLRGVFSLNESLARTAAGEVGSRLAVLAERLQSYGRERARALEAGQDADSVTGDLFEDTPELLRVEVYERAPSATRYERADGHSDPARLERRGLTNDLLERSRRLHPISALVVASEDVHLQNSSVPGDPSRPGGGQSGGPYAILTLATSLAAPNGSSLVVVADLTPDRLLQIFARSAIYTLYLVDGRGTVIAHPDVSKVAGATNMSNVEIVRAALSSRFDQASFEFTRADRVRALGAYSAVGLAHATVVSEIPVSVAESAGGEIIRKAALSAIWIVLFAFLASLYFSRRLTAPLQRLQLAAVAIGKGDFDVRLPAPGADEIGEVTRSFGRMALELRDRERRLAEAQTALVQSAKMAAFGQLGAAITHEVKNPLAGILGFAQFALGKLGDPAIVKEAMETIAKESQRCKEIVEKFLRLARQDGKESFGDVDVNTVIEDTLKVVRHHFQMNRVRAEVTLAPSLPKIQGSASSLQQVFLNMLLNAQDAMPNGGTVRVTTGLRPDATVFVRIADTGTGIAPEVRARIFEPFFTTKAPGKGTGLGLSVSFGIIKEHGGKIELETEVGRGTTFTILLPERLPPTPARPTPGSVTPRPIGSPAVGRGP